MMEFNELKNELVTLWLGETPDGKYLIHDVWVVTPSYTQIYLLAEDGNREKLIIRTRKRDVIREVFDVVRIYGLPFTLEIRRLNKRLKVDIYP